MTARLRSLLLCLALCALATLSSAQVPPAQQVIVVNSDTSAAYVEAAEALTNALVRQGLARTNIGQVSAQTLAAQVNSGLPPRPTIFVTLGSQATQVLVDSGVSTPVLAALLPRRSFERILRRGNRVISSRLTAVYLDQPLARQFDLIRMALPAAPRVGVLLGPEMSDAVPLMRSQAAAHGVVLRLEEVPNSDQLSKGLSTVLADSDVLLALADPLIYNSRSIQNILLTSFRARIPMVAFSPAYVRAGATLALYTTPSQVGTQAAELVAGLLSGKVLPERAIEPNDFEVSVNANVARSLGLSFDTSALRTALRRLERLP